MQNNFHVAITLLVHKKLNDVNPLALVSAMKVNVINTQYLSQQLSLVQWSLLENTNTSILYHKYQNIAQFVKSPSPFPLLIKWTSGM